ncbi:Fic family protein [Gemmatimonadota bacterium]
MEKPRKIRSGTFLNQPTGYVAFVPDDLPPEPAIVYDDGLLQLLSDADRALGRLDGVVDNVPSPEVFVFMFVRTEAVLSSQIEGTQATLLDVLKHEAKQQTEKPTDDTQEVLNYITAMHYGLARLAELPLSLRLIREIHAKLMAGVRGESLDPGEFRRSQNWVGPPGSSISTALYIPPPVHEMNQALHALEIYLHDTSAVPILIKAGLVHAQFESIHPFLDGNGRIGRLLITLFLCEKGILNRPLLYLSNYFMRTRQEYYDRLQATRDKGDWEGWLKYFLQGVADVARDATSTARSIGDLRESHRQKIEQNLGRAAASGYSLLRTLYLKPIISVRDAAEASDLSYSNANSLVSRFCELGILEEISGYKRNRIFAYQPYLYLFRSD